MSQLIFDAFIQKLGKFFGQKWEFYEKMMKCLKNVLLP